MVERPNMAGEGSTSAETGAVATAPAEAKAPAQALEVKPVSGIKIIEPPKDLVQAENITTTPPSPDLTTYQDQVSSQYQETIERLAREAGILPPDGGGGAGDGGGGGPEGPRGPLPPDYLWSPDFKARRWMVGKELFRLAGLPYEERYNDENRPYLNQLYRQWKALEALDNMKSFLSEPFDPRDLEPTQTTPEAPAQPEDPLIDLRPFEIVLDNYNSLLNNRNASPERLAEVKDQLSRYFIEAKRMGLLNGIDKSLKSLYAQIMQGMEVVEEEDGGRRRRMDEDQIMDRMEKARAAMSISGERAFKALQRSDPARVNFLAKIDKLKGIWQAYTELAVERFDLLLNAEGLIKPPAINGEFTFDIGDVGPEGAVAFRRLAQGREIYWRPTWANYFVVTARTPAQFQIAAETFIRWMRTGLGKDPEELFQKVNGFKEAITSAGQRAELEEVTVGLRLELEALMGIIGADFSDEQYKADYFKQFWTFAAKNEGPARMLRLIRTSRGIMAAVLHKFDKDPRLELFFSPHGSRGELMGRQRNASEMLELQKQILAILTAEIMGIAMKGYHPDDPEKTPSDTMYGRNLDKIAKFKSDENFKDLYEGFDLEEQERLYPQLADKQRRASRAREIQEQLAVGMLPSDLQGEDLEIYEELSNGRQFSDLKPAEKETLARLERSRRIQQYLENGHDPNKLQGEDKVMYEEARNAVTLAYELYGAMGEKAKRGGGVFLVDRRDTSGKFRDYIPVHWAEKFVHFAENWTKATYGHLPAAELKDKVAQARRMAIWVLKTDGFDAKLFDFTLLRDRKPVDPNTLGYTKYGVNRRADNEVDRYRYAVPEDARILGYNTNDEEVILVFDADGKPVVNWEFDQQGKAVIYKTPRGDNRERIKFDNLTRDTKAEPMMLKTPIKQADGSFRAGEVAVDFDTVNRQLSSHPYSRWTGHPYWGYQEEDTGLVLAPEAFAAAKRIKSGQLRPEDAPPHAVQLLILDPTLERVGHFDLENLEAVVGLAAVEESYQAHWRIGDELYENFFPADASRVKNRTAYILQDHGGSTKQWFHARAEAALWPDYKVRRLRTFIPYLPLHFASMSEMWGAPGGALDVFRMMGYEKYKMVGQFAMDKWVNQTGGAPDVYESLFDFYSQQEKRIREGLGRKLTNESDRLRKLYKQYTAGDFGNRPDVLTTAEDADEELLIAFRESLNRFEIVQNRNTVLESLMRGEHAPLYVEGIEIFRRKPDGTYEYDEDSEKILNEKIDWERDSGSSRHSNRLFHWRFIRLLRSDKLREGQALYPMEAMYYELGDDYTIASVRAAEEKGDQSLLETRFEWLETKTNN